MRRELKENRRTNLAPSAYIELFKKSMREVLENLQTDEKVIATFWSPNYIQRVDGKMIDYQGFVDHMAALKRHIKSVKIKFIQVIAMDNIVSTIHQVNATKHDGSKSLIQVIGHMTYEGDRLVAVDELTCVLEGHSQDKELGSIR